MMSTSTPTPREFAQQLKGQLSIDQLVAEYVPTLAKKGSSFKGLCPFHKEKTPSFHVHPEYEFYHCFGCGAHGDLIKFVEEIEKVDFMGAIELLARRCGVTLPSFRPGVERSEADEQHRALLREVCAWGEEFFIQQLESHPRGRIAREYLHRRGLTDEEIAHYRLGYAPEGWDTLLRTAAARSWREETVAEAGLASRKESGGFLDRFRDRVMFPIEDRQGQVVAFAGRLLNDEIEAAKYINSAETPIFKKGQLLYGIARSREAIRDRESVILLEGYMDWLALHRLGLGNALAGMGTALTDDQARLIRRMTRRVFLLYDGDEAGRKAMFRATELLLRQGLEVRGAVLSAGEDPDSFIQSNGTQAMRNLLDEAPSAIDYFIESIAAETDLGRPESKAEAVGQLAPLLLAMEDPTLREGYIVRAAQRLLLRPETLEKALRRRSGRVRRPVVVETQGAEEPADPLRTAPRSEQNLLFILLVAMDLCDAVETISTEWFSHEALRTLFERIAQTRRDVREGADPPSGPFALSRNEIEKQWISHLLLLPEQRFGGEVKDYQDELHKGLELNIFKLKKVWREARKRELSQDLQTILASKPIGEGQLAEIHKLSQENVQNLAHFLEQSNPSKM